MKASKLIGSSGVALWVCASTQRGQGASSSQQFGQSNWQATGATAKANPTKNNTSQPISVGLRPKQHRQNRRPNFNLPSWNNTGRATQANSDGGKTYLAILARGLFEKHDVADVAQVANLLYPTASRQGVASSSVSSPLNAPQAGSPAIQQTSSVTQR